MLAAFWASSTVLPLPATAPDTLGPRRDGLGDELLLEVKLPALHSGLGQDVDLAQRRGKGDRGSGCGRHLHYRAGQGPAGAEGREQLLEGLINQRLTAPDGGRALDLALEGDRGELVAAQHWGIREEK